MLPTLPAAVRFHRRKAGLSQAGLARLAGVGKTAVFDIEKGKQTIRLQTLLRVLAALNITLEWNSPLANDFANHTAELPAESPAASTYRSDDDPTG